VSSIARSFDDRASRRPSHVAVREDGREVSFDALRRASERVTRTLEGLGAEAGDRVGLMIPNSAAFVAAYFGIARRGAVVAPLNPRYRKQELDYYLRDTEARVLIATPALAQIAAETLREMESPPALVVIEPSLEPAVLARPAGAGRARGPAHGDGAPLMIQYTSGSTGAPKRVVRTHENLAFELERLSRTLGVGEDDRFLGAAPFSHVNGLVRTMLTSMLAGGTLHPMASFDRRGALGLITEHRITYFGAVPYMFILLADSPLRGVVDLSSLRVAFSASAPLLPADNRRFREKYGIGVRQLYGSTETGTISVNVHDDPDSCIESVGRPLPDVRVDVVDDTGRPVPVGMEGEVAIRSPGAIRGYEGNAEANASTFRNGAYLSGDLGRKNPDGCLVLTGRKKFLINRGGFKVNPLEVEEAIQSHPGVAEVAVYGVIGPHGDDVVHCAIVASGPLSEREILDHCRGRIADFKIPSRIEFRDALPRSETGKILRGKLGGSSA
jgi:long-chain acyl-CoA synthetase